MQVLPQSDKWRRVLYALVGLAGATAWIWAYVTQFGEFGRGVQTLATAAAIWGTLLGMAVYLVFTDPRGVLVLDVSEDLDRVQLAHLNEAAVKSSYMPDGQPVSKSLDGVDGHTEVLVTVDADLDDPEDAKLPATWEKTATPEEYMASKSRIRETYNDLTETAQKAIMLRATFSSVVRRSTAKISDHIHGTLERGEIPEGDMIHETLVETFHEHGLDYFVETDEANGHDEAVETEEVELSVDDVGDIDLDGMLEGTPFEAGGNDE